MKPLVSFLWGVFILFPFLSIAQINDCAEAQVVCDNGDLAFNPLGPGINDFADPDNIPGCLTALEQNSAWYYFEIDPTAPPNLVLGFIISPNGGFGEDYDWALFGPDVNCGDLGAPIRCSSSSAACGFCPETGMGMGALDVTEGPGTGDGFVMTLIVQPGQGFYLLIDNWLGTTNGFVLTWTDSAADYLNCNATPPCALNADAGPNISACEGDEDIPLNGTSTGNNGNETYTWTGTNGGTGFLSDPNVANPTVSIPFGFTGTITYTLTVAEDTCLGEDQMDLTIFPLPLVTINPVGPFCPEDPPQTLTAIPPGGTWGGAATGNSFNPLLQGPGIHTVSYTYTNTNNCSRTEYLDIEVHESPEVTIDPDPASFCDDEGAVLLTATGSAGGGSYTFSWTTPSGTADGTSYLATLSGSHTVTVTDVNGCQASSAVMVMAFANPDVEIMDPGPICASETVFTLTAIPGGGEFSGTIVDPSGEIYPQMAGPGTYTVYYDYTDANGCEGTDALMITIIPTPVAIASNNGPVCDGQPIVLNGDFEGMGTSVTYSWTGPGGYTSDQQNPTDATLGGDYLLYVTIDGCVSAPAVTTVMVGDQPDAIADNDGPYCQGQNIQLLGSTTTSGMIITYAWTGPNGYTADVQNPTDASEAGLYSLIVTVNGCTSEIAETEVIFNTPPDAQAQNPGPYCSGEPVQLFGSTTTPGTIITFAWSGPNGYQSNVQNPTDATSPGTYELIVNVDGCQSDTATTMVIIHPSPQPLITGQDTFCTGFSSIMDAGSGFMNYLWSDASTNQTLEVFSSGIYQVTVTSMEGCSGTASFSVTETPALMPVVSGALAFCEGSSTILDAGPVYTSYTWSTGETSQSITVSAEGNVGVMVTDSDGCTGAATVWVAEDPNPVVTIGGSTTYCIGLSTTLDAGTGYVSYAWSDGSTSQTIVVSTPGLFGVAVVDTNGCLGMASVMISESTSLMPIITGGNAFCEGGSLTLNAGSGFATYQWSGGAVSQTLPVSTPGIYSVTVTDIGGCSGTSSVMVSEVSPPAAILGPGVDICNTTAGGSVLNLYTLIQSGDTGGSWQDLDQSGATGLFSNLNFNLVPAGDYRFQYTTNSAIPPCPESSYVVIITVLDCTCPDVVISAPPDLCNASDVLDLSSILLTTEPGAWSVIQSPAGSNPATVNGMFLEATGSDPGTYTLQFTLQNTPPPGCPISYDLMIDVDSALHAGIASPPIDFCLGEMDVVRLSDLITGEDPNGVWTETSAIPSEGPAFNPANGTFAISGQTEGTYSFQYSLLSTGACPDVASAVSVIVHPLPTLVILPADELNCSVTSISLDASGSSSGPSFDVMWSGPGIVTDGNENSLKPTINKPGTYQLSITSTITNCLAIDSVIVLQNTDAPRTALLMIQNPSCFGDQDGVIQVDQVIGGTAPYQFSFNHGLWDAEDRFTQLPAGDYTVALEDANGCRWDTLIILTTPPDFSISLGSDIEVILGEEANIHAVITPDSLEIDTLIWSPDNVIECFDMDCLDGTVLTYKTIKLLATVYDAFGCSASDEVTIFVRVIRNVYIPNSFSPNGDGINDRLYPFGHPGQIQRIKSFRIFDRWGSLMFEARDFLPNDASIGWDGLFRGEAVNAGVFVYQAEVEYIDGISEVLTGDITLVR